MACSKAEDSCSPRIQVSAFDVIGTQYRGLEIRATNGRRCTKPGMTWVTLALCSAAAIAVGSGQIVLVTSLLLLLLSGIGLVVESRSVYQESVLVLQSVGIHIIKESRLGLTSSYFVPFTIIKDIVINESISKYRVVPYLALLLSKPKERDAKMVARVLPLFEVHSLKYAEMIPLYQEIQALTSTPNINESANL